MRGSGVKCGVHTEEGGSAPRVYAERSDKTLGATLNLCIMRRHDLGEGDFVSTYIQTTPPPAAVTAKQPPQPKGTSQLDLTATFDGLQLVGGVSRLADLAILSNSNTR